jgi:putative glycosyltransferase (TIGR04372 family)
MKDIIKYILSYAFNFILSIINVLVFKIYKKRLVLIKGYSESFGHYAHLDGIYRKKKIIDDNIVIIILKRNKENTFLENKLTLKRKGIKLISSTIIYYLMRFYPKNNAFMNLVFSSTPFICKNDYKDYPIISWLTEEDEEYARQLSTSLSSLKYDFIVSVFARDSLWDYAYLNVADQHNIRNSDIYNYILTINYLINNGALVVRLGKLNKKFNFEHDNFIDLTNNIDNSELLNLFFIKNSEFIIGSPSGPVDNSTLFNTPVGLVNTPYYNFTTEAYTTKFFMPKLFKYKSTNEILKYDYINNIFKQSIIDIPFGFQSVLHKYNLEMIENSSEDLLQFATIMLNHYRSGTIRSFTSSTDIEVIKFFKDKYLL